LTFEFSTRRLLREFAYMITVLTRPLLPWKVREVRYSLINLLHRRRGLPPKRIPVYGGHTAVTRSICQGFANLGIEFNHDPRCVAEVKPTLVCVCDPRSLIQAIQWKRQGRIKRLYAGYTLLGTPLERNRLAMSQELDGYLCFSEWHRMSFDLQCPGFGAKALISPVGVDENHWTPDPASRRPKHLLFYKKRAPHGLYQRCLLRARELGWQVEEIVYGSYSLTDYLASLRRSALLVNWVDHETQGISLAEAWSADVPTLAWNPGFVFQVVSGKGCVFECSSAPYLTDATGRFFRDLDGLMALLADCAAGKLRFSPRQWVLDNMTDTICARRLYAMITAQPNAHSCFPREAETEPQRESLNVS